MEYISFEELNLVGVFKGFGWSLTKYGIKCEEYYLSLNLFITHDWKVSEEILEEDYFHFLSEDKVHEFIKGRLTKMIKKLTDAMEGHKEDKCGT